MNTTGHTVAHDVLADLEEVARSVLSNNRNRDAMRRACERMDRIREENRRKLGSDDFAVEIVREMRDNR